MQLLVADRSDALKRSLNRIAIQIIDREVHDGLLIERRTTHTAAQLLDQGGICLAIGGPQAHENTLLGALLDQVMGALATGEHLHQQQVQIAMGHEFHIRHQARCDAIGDQVAELLLGLQRLLQADHLSAGIRHPDQNHPTGTVGEGHQGLEKVQG